MVSIKRCSCGFEITKEMRHAYENEWCPKCGKGVTIARATATWGRLSVANCHDCTNRYICMECDTGKVFCNKFVEDY